MQKVLFLSLLGLFLFACGGDATDSNTTIETAEEVAAKSEAENTERLSQVAPPPPVCVYLTEAEVLSLFDKGVQIPMAGSRAPGSFHTCQYNLQATGWTAALVVDMPEGTTEKQSIVDEVAGAKGKDALMIGEYKARMMNDGRILSVTAGKAFRVKFSALPKAGFEAPFDAEARRAMLIKLAEAVLSA